MQGAYRALPEAATVRSAFLANQKELDTQMGKISFENFTILHQNQVCALRTVFVQRPRSRMGGAQIPLKQAIQAALGPKEQPAKARTRFPDNTTPYPAGYAPISHNPPVTDSSASGTGTHPNTAPVTMPASTIHNPYADLEKKKSARTRPLSIGTPLYKAPANFAANQPASNLYSNPPAGATPGYNAPAGAAGTQPAQPYPNLATYPQHANGANPGTNNAPAGQPGAQPAPAQNYNPSAQPGTQPVLQPNPAYTGATGPTHGTTPGYNAPAAANHPAQPYSANPPYSSATTPYSTPAGTTGNQPAAPPNPNPVYPPGLPANPPYAPAGTTPNAAGAPAYNTPANPPNHSPAPPGPAGADVVTKPTSEEWQNARSKLSKKTSSVR